MSVKSPIEGPSIGFDFSNYARNQHLGRQLGGLPKGEHWILAATSALPEASWHTILSFVRPLNQPSGRLTFCYSYIYWYYHCRPEVRRR
jgi:hypothetical protein